MLNKEKLQSCSTSVEEGIKRVSMTRRWQWLCAPCSSLSCLLVVSSFLFLKKNIADSAQLSDFSFLKHHANRLLNQHH
ncbi:hypothetical protein EB796_004274 [Bugula neritina]|uniref:Uncharacterized protein n=1 Tax=Bugula neritina TaxID=10212 RepID=A0A7J7KGN7_BUGNE|nr:hypothetical protein EB796_004274 [Bugula neritina]